MCLRPYQEQPTCLSTHGGADVHVLVSTGLRDRIGDTAQGIGIAIDVRRDLETDKNVVMGLRDRGKTSRVIRKRDAP